MNSLSLQGITRNFPPVLSLVEDSSQHILRLDISSDLGWFRGHFPGTPVLAGVVQLHWAVSVSLDLFEFSEVPVEIKRLKFKNIVTPPRILELALNKTNESEVKFEFTSLDQIHSQGHLVFEKELPC